ncbi:MAG: Fe-S protein assembly co-chaperone HscB [Planctomycetota bacterium]|nr:Fe-S protein assembly co-chaperone HscB [Planctomycetota bacterium]
MSEQHATDNPFALLGVAESYALDAAALRDALVRASLRWHPDRFVLATAAERGATEQRMAAINAAYAKLADPLVRAEALLALRGAPFERGTDRVSCPAVLMAMLELREEVAEACAGEDAAQRKAVEERLRAERARVLLALAEACALWEAEGAPSGHAGTVHARLAEAAYVCRAAQDLDRAGAAA